MIVLTGGIATGKSTVADMLRQKGFEVICADALAHEALDEKVQEIGELFGTQTVENGRVNRKVLGEIVFANESARKKLESLIHPIVRQKIYSLAESFARGKKQYIADIPLFFETAAYDSDCIAVVYAPQSAQLKRLMLRDGIDEKSAIARVDSQMNVEIKKQKADFVINNTGDKLHLANEVASFVKFLEKKYANSKIHG